MSSLTKILLLAALSSLVQACVSASKHEKLQKDYDQVSGQLADYKSKYASDETEIQKEKDRVNELELVIKNLESKIGTSSAAQRKLEGSVNEMKTALEALTK